MSRIVIPGGSGFLGQALAARLVARGDDVVILSRDGRGALDGARTVAWDAESIGPWVHELDGAHAGLKAALARVQSKARPTGV